MNVNREEIHVQVRSLCYLFLVTCAHKIEKRKDTHTPRTMKSRD